MLEQRRADYLKAMGVTLWLPRTPLPNAQPPRWIPEKADLQAEQGEQAPVSPRRPAAATTSDTASAMRGADDKS